MIERLDNAQLRAHRSQQLLAYAPSEPAKMQLMHKAKLFPTWTERRHTDQVVKTKLQLNDTPVCILIIQ